MCVRQKRISPTLTPPTPHTPLHTPLHVCILKTNLARTRSGILRPTEIFFNIFLSAWYSVLSKIVYNFSALDFYIGDFGRRGNRFQHMPFEEPIGYRLQYANSLSPLPRLYRGLAQNIPSGFTILCAGECYSPHRPTIIIVVSERLKEYARDYTELDLTLHTDFGCEVYFCTTHFVIPHREQWSPNSEMRYHVKWIQLLENNPLYCTLESIWIEYFEEDFPRGRAKKSSPY